MKSYQSKLNPINPNSNLEMIYYSNNFFNASLTRFRCSRRNTTDGGTALSAHPTTEQRSHVVLTSRRDKAGSFKNLILACAVASIKMPIVTLTFLASPTLRAIEKHKYSSLVL
jgi:hypothetical protein